MATRLKKSVPAIAASLLLLLLLAVPAQAQHEVTACGTTITEPGEWNLVHDLHCVGVDAITVSASDVKLHLNDHHIIGSSTQTGIYTRDHDRIKILGPGSIDSFSIGVLNAGGHDVEVYAVTVNRTSEAGFVARGEQGLVWYSNTAEGNPVGFRLQSCSSCLLDSNVAEGNMGDGFDIAGAGNRVEYDQAFDNGAIGIKVIAGATGIGIVRNRALGNTTLDIADQNPDCGSDFYRDNELRTGRPSCVFRLR